MREWRRQELEKQLTSEKEKVKRGRMKYRDEMS